MANHKKNCAPVPPLSRKQTRIMQLYCEDKATKEIVAELKSARGTIKTHKATIFRKLGVHTIAGAVARFQELQRKAA